MGWIELVELKPCPFCGSIHLAAIDEFSRIFSKGVKMVRCDDCGGAMMTNDQNDCVNDVYKRWNRRASDGQG